MDSLQSWLAREARRERRRASLEDALLGGRFARYAWYRLQGVALTRLIALGVHLVEFGFLWRVFAGSSLGLSLVVQNGCLLAGAFWWGALEVLRARLREERSKASGAVEVGRWLRWAVALSASVIVGAALAVGWKLAVRRELLDVLDAYMLVCCARLVLDLPARTFHASVYARRRIRRPVLSLVVPELAGFGLCAALWGPLGPWSFPLGLAVAVAGSRALSVVYVARAHRAHRLPFPRIRRRASRSRARRRSPAPWREILWAGAANLSTRFGSALVLLLVAASWSGGDPPTPLVLVVHVSTPLFATAAGWAQAFYPDLARLGGDLLAGLRRGLERRLLATACVVGLALWGLAVVLARGLVSVTSTEDGDYLYLERRDLLSLLPLYVGVAVLAARQLPHFASGAWARMARATVVLVAGLAATPAMSAGAGEAVRNLVAAAALLAAAVALEIGGPRRRSDPASGVKDSLLAWRRALLSAGGPVRVGRASLPGARMVQVAALAGRVAERLAGTGAVVARPRQLLFYERLTAGHSPLDDAELVRAAGGTIASLDLAGPADGGAQALHRAVAAGLVPASLAPGAARASREEAAMLAQAFRRLFPEGVAVEAAGGVRAKLAPQDWRAIWREAIAEARGASVRRDRRFRVSTYRPAGELETIFVSRRLPEQPGSWSEWRSTLALANGVGSLTDTKGAS